MRKVFLFDMMSLDGFVAGIDGNINWHNVDDEFNQFAIQQLGEAGGLIFGRVTYEMMASYWPSPQALQDDPVVANAMNSLPKWVVSRTLDRADYQNTTLVKTDPVEAITQLKQQPGKDLFVFGSAKLSAVLIQHNLIDEYRIMINPVVLGSGIPLFQGVKEPLCLKLVNSRPFANGNILLYYQPEK